MMKNEKKPLPGLFQNEILMTGNTGAVIDRVKSINEYNSECVRIQTDKLQIVFRGDGLMLNEMNSDTVSISGNIISAELLT